MTSPRLIVIGAMKAGTTSIHADLAQHPDAEVAEKEFGGLLRFDVRQEKGCRAYRRQWKSGPDALTIDVSANYTMHPHVRGAPEAASTAAPHAKVLYVVRNPIERIVSHYAHDAASSVIKTPIDTAVRSDARLLDYSRYGLQLRQWLRFFSTSDVRVVRFEDYIADRRRVVNDCLAWVGYDPLPEQADLSHTHNARGQRRVPRGALYRALSSDLYLERARPLIPRQLRQRVARAVLPMGSGQTPRLTKETSEWVLRSLEDDLSEIADLTNGLARWSF